MEQEGVLLRIHRHPTLPTYECLIGVGKAHGLALLDTGATASFVMPEMVSTAGLTTHALPKRLLASFVQGSSLPITHYASPNILIHNYVITPQHRLYVTTMSSHDILLGMDWIGSAKPEPNYTLRTWDLRVPHVLPATPTVGDAPTTQDLAQVVGRQQLLCDSKELLTPPKPVDVYPDLRASAADLPPLPRQYADYADVFNVASADQLPPHRAHNHKIHLEEGKTIPYGALYSLSHREQEELRNYLQKMQANGFIRPSSSQAAAPLLFVPKKDGSLRPCVDYRALNAITVKDRYPIPLISEHLDRLSTACIFTKLDLKGAYNLLRIAAGHEWKTAFCTRYGSFEYLVMPFGLCNAPSTFQRLMNHVLANLLDVSVIVYLDDILVFSEEPDNHPRHVLKVLERLRKNQLYCAPDKCDFHTTLVEFLGYMVSPTGVSMDPSKVQTVVEWPPPKSIQQIQVFLGFANFYRRFIRHYSRVAAPLTNLLKGAPLGRIQLPPAALAAFQRLKQTFTEAPILHHFLLSLSTVLETDAVVAAVLSQWHPRPGVESQQPNSRTHTLHPVAYWSRKMIPAERNYKIHDKELLAIVGACAHWRHYLHGLSTGFLVYTDHQALQYFNTKQQLNRRQAQWAGELAEFDFTLQYCPGKEAVRPNALSRRHDLFPNGPSKPDPANHMTLLPDRVFAAAATLDVPTTWAPVLRNTHDLPDGVRMVNGQPTTAEGLLYLPEALRSEALALVHDHPTAGHPGPCATVAQARRRFWWPSLIKDATAYAQSCAACQRAKHPRHKPYGYLLPSAPPDRPWSKISMDHITNLPPSVAAGVTHNSILVVVDRLTKYAVFIPANKTNNSHWLAYQLHRYVFAYFGLPDNIVSNRGTMFVSSVWVELLQLLRIKGSFSSAYHPQSDGQTERTNQSLELFLRLYTAYDQTNWATLLPTAQLAINDQRSSTTGVILTHATLAFAPQVHPLLPTLPTDAPNHARLTAVCQEGIRRANNAMSTTYDRRRSDVSFRRGDLVLLRTKHLRLDRPNRKLANPLAGPFKIDSVVGTRAYRLLLPPNWKVHLVFHVEMLKPYPHGTRESTDAPQSKTLEDDYTDYEIKAVVDSRRRGGCLQYKVRWVGYAPSWVPAEDVDQAAELLESFHRQHPDKPRPRGL